MGPGGNKTAIAGDADQDKIPREDKWIQPQGRLKVHDHSKRDGPTLPLNCTVITI